MNENSLREKQTEEKVKEDLQRQPHLFMKLAQNALTVAESLRDNYFSNTARFIVRRLSKTQIGQNIRERWLLLSMEV